MNSPTQHWKDKVAAHHEQSTRARNGHGETETDSWRPIGSLFMADPLRTHDQILNRISMGINKGISVIDVGGGAGRYALPLALAAKHVTVVEPSQAMVEILREQAEASGISNLSVVQASWEDAKLDSRDVVLCSHVVDGTLDVSGFVGKLNDHARQRVIMVESMESPQTIFAPFWERVHGEWRMNLPGIPELMGVLWEMGLHPELEMFEPTPVQAVPTREAALTLLRSVLSIDPESDKDQKLHSAVNELAIETPKGLEIKNAKPRREALISWRPEPNAGVCVQDAS